jgi:hypothetical protein
MESCPVDVLVGLPLIAGQDQHVRRVETATSRTDPITDSSNFFEALEAVIKTVLRCELLQIHHGLESLCVALDIKEH